MSTTIEAQPTDNRTQYEKERDELSVPVARGSLRYLQLEAEMIARGFGSVGLEDITDAMRGELYATFFRPEPAVFVGDAPAWSSDAHSDRDGSIAMNGNPVAVWSTDDIFHEGHYSAAIVREDEYDVDSSTTKVGPSVLGFYADDSGHLTEPDTIRRIGFGLLKAADRYDDIMTEASPTTEEVFTEGQPPYRRVAIATASPDVFLEVNNEMGDYRVYFEGPSGELLKPSLAEFMCIEILQAAHIAEQLNAVHQ